MVHWSPAGPRGLDSAALVEAVSRVALAWRGLGLERGQRVAILSENRPEWLITDYAVMAAGGVPVPVYTSLAPAQVLHILGNAGARGIVVSTRQMLEKILSIREQLPDLEFVVLMEGEAAANAGVMGWRELVDRGSQLKLRDPDAFTRLTRAAQPSDLATIIYTSGTTGDPKGVMLTHDNFISNVKALQQRFNFTPADRALSFLPLSHVFERMADYLFLMAGVTIVHVELEDVAEALPAMRPTILVAVPRLYEKLRERIEERVAAASQVRQRMFRWARATGRRVFLEPLLGGPSPSLGDRLRMAVADRLVLRKIRSALGGRVRRPISGGAPLPREVLEYFATLGIFICEGYGLTETSPALTINHPDAIGPGTVGPPLPGVDLRIAEDGEILARGRGIMKGYYKDEEATARVIVDGWFHTGDIGELDAEGALRITDRKKDLIVTSGGKNVAPQVLEQAIVSTGKVSQAVVLGNGRKFISALLVPDPAALDEIRRSVGAGSLSRESALEHPAVVEAFSRIINEALKDFAPYERVKRFALLPREFTQEAGELTPTLKVKRRVVESKHRELIDSFYRVPAGDRT